MKLKLNFVSKNPKLAVKSELIFINNKNFKHKTLDHKEITDNELFKEKKIIQRNQGKSNYILINCIEQKKSSDFENIGSTQKSHLEIKNEMKIDLNTLFKANNEWYNNY